MNVFALTGQKCDLHELGHNGDPASKGTLAVSKMIAWHMKHFAYLIGKLRDTTEGAGSLLDNVALVFLHEGGHGLDTATGKTNSTHSTENMAAPDRRARRRPQGRPARRRHRQAPRQRPDHGDERRGRLRENLGEVTGHIPGLLGWKSGCPKRRIGLLGWPTVRVYNRRSL